MVAEVINLDDGVSKISKNYFNRIYAIILNNYSGGEGKTYYSSSESSINNLNEKTSLIISEVQPLKLYPSSLNSYQDQSPNFDLATFISSDPSRSIEDEIALAISSKGNISEVFIDLEGEPSLSFEKNGDVAKSFGQKFISNSNNLQKVEFLISVDKDSVDNYDWSGDLVVSIYELSTELDKCANPRYPNQAIDFDPEISPIGELTLDKSDLDELGVFLTDTPTIVPFDFSDTLLANPNIEPSIVKDAYYAVVIKRSGSNLKGTINIHKGSYLPSKRKTWKYL